ncbi:hypothetical protein NQ176_g10505 [Zarea fungicola]|uniref:Uncharacterized protein n=1 Tax=Zarea fungicola TaxID=93591 RepID=A0ACC1MGA1_9HYPO|nr:hypothetical protein NQ176_g10505 [Lecanicillium fungicola]
MGSIASNQLPVRVFIAGGSYAGLSTAMNLLDLATGSSPRMSGDVYPHVAGFEKLNVEITIADERDGFFHLIGSPLALADSEYAKKAWVKFQDIPSLQHPSINIVIGTVAVVDCASKTVTTIDAVTKAATQHTYDYFVAASGLRRVWPVVPQSLSRKHMV